MMEVDSVEGWNNNPPDGAKFANLKAFVNAAREFEATHSESAINLMTRYLGVSFSKKINYNKLLRQWHCKIYCSSMDIDMHSKKIM